MKDGHLAGESFNISTKSFFQPLSAFIRFFCVPTALFRIIRIWYQVIVLGSTRENWRIAGFPVVDAPCINSAKYPLLRCLNLSMFRYSSFTVK
jgi:hypothetical protein